MYENFPVMKQNGSRILSWECRSQSKRHNGETGCHDGRISSVTENERGDQAFLEILGWSDPAVKKQPLWSMEVHNSQADKGSH